jgi:HK97 gp10 family phage protein
MPAQDIRSGALQVTGLKQARDNMAALPAIVKLKVGRDALRAAAWTVEHEVQARTYTTFHRLTGAIGAGLRVGVGHQLKGEVLNAVVGEFPQQATAGSPMGRLLRQSYGGSRADKYAFGGSVAFWWRFLELGTGPRRAMRTPRGAHPSKQRVDRWMSSGNRGAISPRPWVRPALAASAQNAVDVFRRTLVERIEAEVNQLPK